MKLAEFCHHLCYDSGKNNEPIFQHFSGIIHLAEHQLFDARNHIL
jgi:hypothetical protein